MDELETQLEYVAFVVRDTAGMLAQAVGIYVVALSAYWALIP